MVLTRPSSEATIFWPDRSTTHLGENSKLVIERMRVASDYSHIELVVSLEKGKVWSNMIRTLYPGSEATFKLPNQGIVAGVRGTVLDINLDAGYIHSVDHIVTLKNNIFQTVELMPGEIVSVWDMFKKLSSSAIDAAWEQANILRDQSYELMRSTHLESAWDLLAGKMTAENGWDALWKWFDGLVRWILEKFSVFREVNVAEKIESLDAQAIMNMPQETLLKWYQILKTNNFVEERDVLRGGIMNMSGALKNPSEYMDILFTESLWDKMSFPQVDLSYTNQILMQYSSRWQTDLGSILESFHSQNYGDLLKEKIHTLF